MRGRVHVLPKTVISRYSNTYAKKSKAPWGSWTASCAALNGHLHILEYLVERKYDQYNECACANAAENGHLDCLKYLHETAKAPWDEDAVVRARERPPRMFTIPPRQRLPFTRWLAIRARGVTRDRIRIRIRILTCNNTQRETRTQTK